MFNNDLLYRINEGVLCLLLVALFFSAVELGFLLGRRTIRSGKEDLEGHVATIEAALLGLLALLLGFGFSMAVNRFDARRAVVVSEANDIGTAYLRADLLPMAHSSEARRLLLEYLDSRIAFFKAGTDVDLSTKALERTLELQRQIWARTVMADREATNPVSSGLFVSAINTLIDVHTERLAALENHVPEVILFLLIFVASATLAITGYRAGLCGVRLVIPRAIVVALIVATLAVIVDLDRPRRGFIKVSENALLELKASLRAP